MLAEKQSKRICEMNLSFSENEAVFSPLIFWDFEN